MPNDNYANEPNQSRSEDIIQSIIDGTEYDEPAQSRIEYLLKQLKAFIAELVTKGVSLIGETSTALTDNSTTNPITVNGKSYTAQPNDAVVYGHKEFLFDGTKWHEFGDLTGLSSKDIGAMTNYVKAITAADIDPTDTLNQAIGKLEKRVSDNENNILLLNDEIVKLDFGFHDVGYLGKFAVGGLEIDGSLKPSQTSRVSSVNTVTFPDYDVRITIHPNFTFGYIPFINGEAGAWSDWFCGTTIIPANTVLKFQIAPKDAVRYGNPYNADVDTWTKAIMIENDDTIYNYKHGRGTIEGNGIDSGFSNLNKRLVTSFINVENINKIVLSINPLYYYGWHTYDNDYNSIDNATGFINNSMVLDLSGVKYLRVNFKKHDDSILVVSDFESMNFIMKEITVFSNSESTYNYNGIVNIRNSYRMKNYATYTPASALPTKTQQGLSIYNGKAFLLYDRGGLAIYDLIKKQAIAELTLDCASTDNHCNSANFSTEIISGGVYPLLYISECYGQHRCFVENITNESSTTIQTIIFANENGDYTNSTYNNAFDWILDNDTGMLMTYGLMSDGKHKIKMFAKPNTNSATVTLHETDVVEEWTVEDNIYPALSSNYVYQGNCAKGGIIYLLTYQSNEIICIDENTHEMTARVPLTFNTSGEPEDLAIYADTMFVVYGDKKIYGMSFD